MRIFTYALATVMVLSGKAEAQKTHVVTSGQTLSHIAAKYGVAQNALLRANHLSNAHKLKLGQKLVIPQASKSLNSTSAKTVAKNSARNQGGGYTVRNGDHDWAIAKKLGITVAQLHKLNPGVDWKKLQIGQSLRVPGGKSVSAAPKLASNTKVKAGGTYTVQKNDNDWIIARKVGTTPSKLRAVNPGVKWTGLQIGQKLRVPGSGSSSSASLASYNKISTRHAVIAKDDVNIRKNASTNSATIATVPKGTYVTVLDREAGWYKLKFPKGTVGWVRGDMLKPLSSKHVAKASSSRSKRTNYVASNSKPKGNFGFSPTKSLAVLDFAESMLGVRYRYGSASRSATDCSGMVLQAFRAVGVKLPRTSAAMSKVGAAVPKDQLKAGDLVFFKTRGSRISHVGIYMGGGRFIHASSSGGSVRTDSLNGGYYQRRYAGARRVTAKPAPGKDAILAQKEAEEQERLVKEKIAAKGETEPVDKDDTPPADQKTQGSDDIIR